MKKMVRHLILMHLLIVNKKLLTTLIYGEQLKIKEKIILSLQPKIWSDARVAEEARLESV